MPSIDHDIPHSWVPDVTPAITVPFTIFRFFPAPTLPPCLAIVRAIIAPHNHLPAPAQNPSLSIPCPWPSSSILPYRGNKTYHDSRRAPPRGPRPIGPRPFIASFALPFLVCADTLAAVPSLGAGTVGAVAALPLCLWRRHVKTFSCSRRLAAKAFGAWICRRSATLKRVAGGSLGRQATARGGPRTVRRVSSRSYRPMVLCQVSDQGQATLARAARRDKDRTTK